MTENRKLKIERRKRPELMALVMLLFSLSIIFIILKEVQRNFPELPPAPPQLPGGQKAGVLDSAYYNYYFHFSVTRPSPAWTFRVLPADSSVDAADTTRAIFPQVHWQVELENSEKSGLARIGVLRWPGQVYAKDLAITLLAEWLEKYETPAQRAKIVIPVSTPAHKILQGAYLVVVLPPGRVSRPVRVLSVLPRNDLAYILVFESSEANYPALKEELEKIASGFTALSKSVRPMGNL